MATTTRVTLGTGWTNVGTGSIATSLQKIAGAQSQGVTGAQADVYIAIHTGEPAADVGHILKNNDPMNIHSQSMNAGDSVWARSVPAGAVLSVIRG